jgi:hypothetical protein
VRKFAWLESLTITAVFDGSDCNSPPPPPFAIIPWSLFTFGEILKDGEVEDDDVTEAVDVIIFLLRFFLIGEPDDFGDGEVLLT